MSLNARFWVSSSLILIVFVVVTALVLEGAFADSARAAMRERLFAQIYYLLAAAEVEPQGEVRLPARLAEPRLMLPGSGLYVVIRDAGGRILWESPSSVGADMPLVAAPGAGQEGFRRVGVDDGGFFIATLDVLWEVGQSPVSLNISVAEDLVPFQAQLAAYRGRLLGWLGGMALVLLLVQAWVIRWSLRPLHAATAELKAIEDGSQDRLRNAYPRELRQLTANLNTLLVHEKARLTRSRNALADLAHSLKTPLAVLRGIDAGPGGDPQAGVLITEQVARMDDIVEHQLQRAMTTGATALGERVDAVAVARRIVDSLNKVYRDRHIDVNVRIPPGTRLRMAEGDLMELLGNLLDNAYKWCHAKVVLKLRRAQGVTVFCVEDDGPGMDAAGAEQLLQRGVRLDESRPGHGMGMAMVRDIAQVYGGTVRIDASALGGSRVKVYLRMS